MAMELKTLLMEINTKVTIKMENLMDMANICGIMVPFIKASFKMDCEMVRENTLKMRKI